MHPRSRTELGVRQAVLAFATLALLGLAAGAAAQDGPAQATTPLAALFEAAWARQPEPQALQARQQALQAQRNAAAAWTPEPPALEATHKTDRLNRNAGARELELALSVPLWLPGERRGAAALADAQAQALESQADAARLRLAAAVREAWWAWQRAGLELELAQSQRDGAQRLAADVARRARAGELARADQHQADAAVAAAEASLAQAAAEHAVARRQVQALGGLPPPAAAGADTQAEPEPSSVAQAAGGTPHPALADLQHRARLAERQAALLATQSRAHPELLLATTRERAVAGERSAQSLTLGLRIPFGGGARHESGVATARAEALEAQAQVALEQARLEAERDAAMARWESARLQQAATERRAALARETRGFFEKSFRLGESDLPTRLRVEAEAFEADRQAARARIDVAAALSAWRQALGLLPQ